MEAAMDLMRRISPNQSETALSALLALLPHHSSELLSQVDQPLQVLMDVECAKEFILCEYNRDADSYRSPWSNKYFPPLEDGSLPSDEMRKLEIEANDVFAVYRDQYYEGGVSSVYIWEDDRQGFVSCFLIKKDGSKTGDGRRGYLHEGSWEAIHVIEVGPEEDGKAHYCLTSTVMLSLTTEEKPSGTFNLSGSIRRQMNCDFVVADGHLCNMGKMIEEMEGKLRNSLDQVYFGKTREMVCALRPPPEVVQVKLPDRTEAPPNLSDQILVNILDNVFNSKYFVLMVFYGWRGHVGNHLFPHALSSLAASTIVGSACDRHPLMVSSFSSGVAPARTSSLSTNPLISTL